MFYLTGRVILEKKRIVFFKNHSQYVLGQLKNNWKTIFVIAIVLKITISLSSVRFLILHIFDISVSLTISFFLFHFFVAKVSN